MNYILCPSLRSVPAQTPLPAKCAVLTHTYLERMCPFGVLGNLVQGWGWGWNQGLPGETCLPHAELHSFIHSCFNQTSCSRHWAIIIHVDLKIMFVCVKQMGREGSKVNGEEIIWYVFILRQSIKLETMGSWTEGSLVKGRSELETEMIIWYVSATLLSSINLFTSWRHAL